MRDRNESDDVVVPDELDSFIYWCIERGEMANHEYTGDRLAWVAARHDWAEVRGWPGGESAMLAGEAEEPDQDAFEEVGLPHGGGWRRREGEDFLTCCEHEATVDEHEGP